MTREEAIKILQRTKHSYDTMPKALRKIMAKYPPNANECSQALDLAIESLSADDVVRCTECRHWNSETKGCKRNPSVEAWSGQDFCSYGERREQCD